MPFGGIGKFFMIAGSILVVLGGLLSLAGKIPWLGHLPGDIYFKRGNFQFHFPLGTSIVLSLLFSLILSLFFRR